MKSRRSAQANNTRGLSNAVIAKLYLDLQRLRDKVRKAEINCAPKRLKAASGSESTCSIDLFRRWKSRASSHFQNALSRSYGRRDDRLGVDARRGCLLDDRLIDGLTCAPVTVIERSAGRRPSFLSSTVQLPSAVACRARTRFPTAGADFGISAKPGIRSQCTVRFAKLTDQLEAPFKLPPSVRHFSRERQTDLFVESPQFIS